MAFTPRSRQDSPTGNAAGQASKQGPYKTHGAHFYGTRKRSEEFSARSHAFHEVFDVVFARALQEAGMAHPGQPVRLNMHPQQLEELRRGYKTVFRVGLRDRLVRDMDFDTVRFSDASNAFL